MKGTAPHFIALDVFVRLSHCEITLNVLPLVVLTFSCGGALAHFKGLIIKQICALSELNMHAMHTQCHCETA